MPKSKTRIHIKDHNIYTALAIVIGVVLIGIILHLSSHAASPYVAVEAKSGTLSTGATIGSDTATIGGEYVKFGTTTTTASRSPYTWPFSWDSPWNIPIASTAQYVPAGLTNQQLSENQGSGDFASTDPSFPVKTLTNARLADGSIGPVQVYVDPTMSASGNWNECSAFLGTDNSSVYQGQTLELSQGGNPTFGGVADVTWGPVAIEGEGIPGCHGGSGLSGLGGNLTVADLTGTGPIQHAIKLNMDCDDFCSPGFVWPAQTTQGGGGGSNPYVQYGSLLALPPSVNPMSFSDPLVQRLATELQNYGGYIVDDGPGPDLMNLVASWNAVSDFTGGPNFNSEIDQLFDELDAVTNQTQSTPGGGVIGASRCAQYAPEFDDGNDAPPAVTVVHC